MTLKQGCTALLVQTAMGLILIPTSRHPVDEDVEEAIEGGDMEEGGKESRAHPLVAQLGHFAHEGEDEGEGEDGDGGAEKE